MKISERVGLSRRTLIQHDNARQATFAAFYSIISVSGVGFPFSFTLSTDYVRSSIYCIRLMRDSLSEGFFNPPSHPAALPSRVAKSMGQFFNTFFFPLFDADPRHCYKDIASNEHLVPGTKRSLRQHRNRRHFS